MESYKNTLLPPEKRAKLLLSKLTLREKVGQLNQRIYGFTSYIREDGDISLSEEFINEVEHWGGLGALYGLRRADPWSHKDFSNGLEDSLTIKAYNKIQKYVIEHSKHGIPVLMCEECPHGHQALDGYLLPVNLTIGATWNPPLAAAGFRVCAEQLAEQKVDMALVSMLDILRDPRWGRSEECYSEDPHLSSKMAEAITTALTDGGIDVVAKHCCAQGETNGGTNASAALLGERELREIHLPAVKSAVEAGALGIMAAYNEIDGIPCHANSWLLRKVLRNEYGFKGVVMADGRAVDRLNILADTPAARGAEALRTGVDLSLWDEGFSKLESAVESGLIDEKLIDEAVVRVLTLKFKRGLFENPYIEIEGVKKYTFKEYPQTLDIARDSLILLKNENRLLPLPKDMESLAVIGPFADDIYALLGDYTPPQRQGAVITPLKGILNEAGNIAVTSVSVPFPADPIDQEAYIDKSVTAALSSDKTILFLGGSSSRFQDMIFANNGAVISKGNDGKYLNPTDCGEGVDIADTGLPEWQYKLLESLKNTGKPIITVIISGRPYATERLEKSSDALCYAFYPGPAGGIAIAEMLFGKIAPNGRLPVSLPRKPGQFPVYYNNKASYIARYSDCAQGASYSFGYGLSYVDFEFSSIIQSTEMLTLAELESSEITFTFSIKNSGNIKAAAVPQLYLRDKIASVTPRVRCLKAFTKITLNPGEEKQCTLKLCAEDFKLWNREMHFTAEAGNFEISLFEGTKNFWQGNFTVTA